MSKYMMIKPFSSSAAARSFADRLDVAGARAAVLPGVRKSGPFGLSLRKLSEPHRDAEAYVVSEICAPIPSELIGSAEETAHTYTDAIVWRIADDGTLLPLSMSYDYGLPVPSIASLSMAAA